MIITIRGPKAITTIECKHMATIRHFFSVGITNKTTTAKILNKLKDNSYYNLGLIFVTYP